MISRYTVRKKSRALLVGALRLLFLIGLCFIILYPLFKGCRMSTTAVSNTSRPP